MDAVNAAGSSSDAQAQLVRYQQQLAKDLAAKAAAKVITADREAVAKAQKAVREAQQTSAPTTATLDVTV